MVQHLKNLTSTEVKIAKRVVQRNAYFAHPEWILATLLTDTDRNVRQEAVNVIHKIRKGRQRSTRPDQTERDNDDGVAKLDADESCSDDEFGEQEAEEEDITMSKDIRYFIEFHSYAGMLHLTSQ